MTHEYRHKIMRWLTSMLMLFTYLSIRLCLAWFYNTNQVMLSGRPNNWFTLVAGPLSDPLFAVVYVFPAFIFWHLADFLENLAPGQSSLTRLTRYRVLASSLFLVGIFDYMRSAHRFWVMSNCGHNMSCSGPNPAIENALMLLLSLLWLLGLLKLAVTLWSRLRGDE